MPPSDKVSRGIALNSSLFDAPREDFQVSMRALDRLDWTEDRPHRTGWWLVRVGPDAPRAVWFDRDKPNCAMVVDEGGNIDELPSAWGWDWQCLALALV